MIKFYYDPIFGLTEWCIKKPIQINSYIGDKLSNSELHYWK